MIRSIMRLRTSLRILVHTFQQNLINYLNIGKYFTCCSKTTHLLQVLYKIPGLFRHEWFVEAIAVLASGDQMVAFRPTWEEKMAIYCPQGSGTLRQQLLMMH